MLGKRQVFYQGPPFVRMLGFRLERREDIAPCSLQAKIPCVLDDSLASEAPARCWLTKTHGDPVLIRSKGACRFGETRFSCRNIPLG